MSRHEKDWMVSIAIARAHFSELLERVAQGETVTIIRRGTPIARMVPPQAAPTQKRATPAERAEAIRRWRETAREVTLGGLRNRDLLEEGRP